MSKKRFAVYRGSSDELAHYAKPKVAMEWVARRLANIIGPGQIRMVSLNREVVHSSVFVGYGGQRDAYEVAAIEINRKFVQGGAVSGHRRQWLKEPFLGAKVGHQ